MIFGLIFTLVFLLLMFVPEMISESRRLDRQFMVWDEEDRLKDQQFKEWLELHGMSIVDEDGFVGD